MGAKLYRSMALFRNSIDNLETALAKTSDGPSWSLKEQLLASGDNSQVHLAEVSQLLTTALQIALVDLLAASGIRFSAVIGHSSGEIAAAYAAGYISATDAVRIAFHRGRSSNLAASPNGQDGKMLAASMSEDEATIMCQKSEFVGRVSIGAVNSKSHVTLTGDANGIQDLHDRLSTQGVFTRLLKVDKAYHSHHMIPCASDYIASLQKCNIQPKLDVTNHRCTWYSTVYGIDVNRLDDFECLRDTYWAENMMQPVLFYQALSQAVESGTNFDMAIEVGPHPALKFPTKDTFQSLTGDDILYQGVLRRNENDMTSFFDAIGFIWANTPSSAPVVDFNGFRSACLGYEALPPKVQKDLSPYPWVHKSFFKESRESKLWRMRGPSHELLGTVNQLGNSDRREMRWSKIWKVEEMGWLRGHQFQNQFLFPAAGYITMAIDSITQLLKHRPLRLIELQDIRFHRAIILEEATAGIQVAFVIKSTQSSPQQVTVEYSCYTCGVDAVSQVPEETNFTGRALVVLDESTSNTLPRRLPPKLPMSDIDVGRFYKSIHSTGLMYSPPFLLKSIRRRLHSSTVTGNWITNGRFQVHPASLDAAFHSLFAAYCFPGDGRMQVPYLPASIRRVRISTGSSQTVTNTDFLADCYLKESPADVIRGDVDIFRATDHQPRIQVHDIMCFSFASAVHPETELFSRTVWRSDTLSSIDTANSESDKENTSELYYACERTACFYLRQLARDVRREEIPLMDWSIQCFVQWAMDYLLPKIASGHHERLKPEWMSDSRDMIMAWKDRYRNNVDLELIHSVGEDMSSIIRGTTPLLQTLMKNDMLNRFYEKGLALDKGNLQLAALVGHLTHRYPRMRILEVGAGTAAATGAILKTIGQDFESYTFTDISSGYFSNAQSRFEVQREKMVYKVLDIGRPLSEQGFELHSFDLVIASHVLHATKSLSSTIRNCRELLRPGGYLMMVEITAECLRIQFAFGGFPDWWLGRDDGRASGPTVSEARWDSVLRENGFSGLDHTLKDSKDMSAYCLSTMVSQAVDDRVVILREPLSHQGNLLLQRLVIIGGSTTPISDAILSIKSHLSQFVKEIVILSNIDEVEETSLKMADALICMSDLEEPLFKSMNEKKFRALQAIFYQSKHILWVSQGRRADEPYANIMIGASRSIIRESPHLQVQFIDIDSVNVLYSQPLLLPEALLRLVYLTTHDCGDILWSRESELAVEKGSVVLPRVIPDVELNKRFDSDRQTVFKQVKLDSSCVRVMHRNQNLEFEQDTKVRGALGGNPDIIQLVVHSSSVSAFSFCGEKPVYIFIGTPLNSESRVLGVTTMNSSLVEAAPNQVIQAPSTRESHDILSRVLLELLCKSAFSGITGTLWVHDADPTVAAALRSLPTYQGVKVFFSWSFLNDNSSAHFIHPYASDRELSALVPPEVDRFISMSAESTAGIEQFLHSYARTPVEILHWNSRRKDVVSITIPGDQTDIGSIVNQVSLTMSKESRPPSKYDGTSVKVGTISQGFSLPSSPLHTINWLETEPLSVRVRPLELGPLISAKKTYFLCGMTGQLGLSLCEWMIQHGARYVALASRDPHIHPEILKNLERKGGHVSVYSLDVGDRDALQVIYQKIKQDLPPIGGVANAAMVLRDKPFNDMSLRDFSDVLRPKVDGSKNLDDLFHSTELDFFILFSSITSVVGSPGQSNYGAANMFMSSLAAQRRRRGVAASIIDIGTIPGIGYLARMDNARTATVESQFRLYDYLPICEPHFHRVFAEAIATGKPESGMDTELITGLQPSFDAPWVQVPMLSHFVANQDTHTRQGGKSSTGSSSLGSMLGKTSTDGEYIQLLEKALSEALGTMLQLDSTEILTSTPLTKLGIDSLVAVQIRSWFLKELSIDIPIFKMLGGASISEICSDITDVAQPKLRVQASMDEVGLENLKPPSTRIRSDRYLTDPTEDPEILASCSVPIKNAVIPASDTLLGTKRDTVVPGKTAKKIRPMSHTQAGIFFQHEFVEDKSTYNITCIGKLHGKLDMLKLESALHEVGKHHESLRSSYYIDRSKGQPVQAVNDEPRIVLEYRQAAQIDAEIDHLSRSILPIDEGCVMNITVIPKTDLVNCYHLVVVYHHIAMDGFSWGVFLADLERLYAGGTLDSLTHQATDIPEMGRLAPAMSSISTELDYWAQLYGDNLAPLPLFPFAKVKDRRMLKDYDAVTLDTELEPQLAQQIRRCASQLHITPFHFYLATLSVFLTHCLDIRDLSIGVADANRNKASDSKAIGCFVNMLPLRCRLEGDQTFEMVAKEMRSSVIGALANSAAPFDLVLERLQVPRSTSHHPLFQVSLNYRNGYPSTTRLSEDSTVEWVRAIPSRNPYDLAFDVAETPGRTTLSLTVQKYMYCITDGRLLIKWYSRCLDGFVRNTSLRISQCPVANQLDLLHVANLGRNRQLDVNWEGTLLHQVDKRVASSPGSIALKDGYGRVMTYSQMMDRVHQISVSLRGLLESPRSIVGMVLKPTADSICCLLAVMRTGYVWVPLDIRNHPERTRKVVLDCRPQIIIYDTETEDLAQLVTSKETTLVNLDGIHHSTDVIAENDSEVNRLAAILYTSGSTGRPKGVMISHANLLNQIYVNTNCFGFGQEVVLQQGSIGFDFSIDRIFIALANGGTLILVPEEKRADPRLIAELLLSERVTYTGFVMSELTLLFHYGSKYLKKCDAWRWAIIGGEKITPQIRKGFRSLGLANLKVINAYGPTETTVSCARGNVPYWTEEELADRTDSLWPLPNYELVITDQHMNPLPVGMPGEICIAGAGVTNGYLNLPDQTSDKFIPKENLPQIMRQGGWNSQWQTVYRTGDKGRILEDGSLHILGRLGSDSQVKILGQRVELDEIANVILEVGGNSIIDAAVSFRPQSETLAAFVVFEKDFVGDKSSSATQLKALPLPPYMCPAFVIPIESIPLMSSGKKDRRAIDELFIFDDDTEKIGALDGIDEGALDATGTKRRMIQVWQEVLGRHMARISQITASSDFFHVGGNSMMLIKLRLVIQSSFGVTVSLPELFQFSTLQGMVAKVDEATSGSIIPVHIDMDWAGEVDAICDGLSKATTEFTTRVKGSVTHSTPKVVLLTGATGFLGGRILRYLVESDRVMEVHCVSIREDGMGNRRHVAIESGKVVEYTGDLTDQSLGLRDPEFNFLANNIDLIIHCGAEVAYLRTYQSLRAVNVLSTRTLCELAIPRKIPMHFISSGVVARFTDFSILPELSVVGNLPPSGTSYGYAASKWVSEAILERMNVDQSLPVCIHRAASMVGDGAPDLDLITALVRYSRLLKAVPTSETTNGYFDLIEVDEVAKGVTEQALDPHWSPGVQLGQIRPPQFVHHCRHTKLDASQFRKYIENDSGIEFEELGLQSWLSRALERGLSPLIRDYMVMATNGGQQLSLVTVTKGVGIVGDQA